MTAADGEGATPVLRAGDLVGAVPDLAAVEGLRARTVRTLPGVHLSLPDALDVARVAAAELAEGRGVVVTTGTDTLEEMAVLCDALHGGDEPLVLTGAIRPSTAPGGDGPANLLDAVVVAAGDEATGCGGLVVFGGEIHAATEARKTDVTSPRAFSSPRTGALGHVAERRIALHTRPRRLPTLRPERLDFRVPIVASGLGDDGGLLRAAAEMEPDGIVVTALGGGHLSPAALAELQAVRGAGVPVALCVRPERGVLLEATYGYHGGESDVRATGVIPAGQLSPPAARMRLLAALGSGLSGAELSWAVAAER